MHPLIADRRDALKSLCQQYGVQRLAVFGSAARGADFDPARSDIDFLVEFKPLSDLSPFRQYDGLAGALESLLGRPVDLVDREAIERSRNYIRRRAILSGAEPVYG
jgi:predicted nucleotidyltransferase